MKLAPFTATAASAWLLCLPALASSFDTLGYDVETGSQAGANLAFGRSLGVLHTNPALMPSVPDQVHLGFSFFSPQLHVGVMPKPRGTDVPISIYDSNLGAISGLQDRALPTVELPNRRASTDVTGFQTSLALGFASDFGIRGLKVGALIQMPLTGAGDSSASTHYDDEREATFSNRVSFARFGQWDHVAVAIVGAGYELTPWLSLGVSLQVEAAATARFPIYVPDAAVQSYSQSTGDMKISLSYRPVVGLRWSPAKWASVGVAWRDEGYFKIDGESDVTLWNYHEAGPDRTVLKKSSQSLPVVFGYQPMEVSAGIGVKQGPVTAQLTGTWQRWSHYLDGHGQHPEEAAAFPPNPLDSRSIDTDRYRFNDTIAIQAGAAWQLHRSIEASIGGAWYPSPVPAQVGRTSYADGTLVGLTTGQRYDVKLFGRSWVVALGVSAWRMLPRTTYKDPTQIVDEFPDSSRTLQSNHAMPEAAGLQTNNPGFPGYDAGGWLLSGGVSLSHLF